MTETQADELIELVTRGVFFAEALVIAMAFTLGTLIFKAWWYAKNQRDIYLIPLAIAALSTSSATAQTVLFDDQFNGPDGQYLALHTPDVDVSGVGWTSIEGTYTIQGSELRTTTSPADWKFTAAANGVLTIVAGTPIETGMVSVNCRRDPVDGSSVSLYWINSGEVRIREYTPATGVVTKFVGNVPYTAGTALSLKLDGTSLTLLTGSTVVGTATSTLNLEQTQVALRTTGIGRTFQRVTFTTLPPAPPTPGGFTNPALIYTGHSNREYVIESVGTPPAYFNNVYDDAHEPMVGVDVWEVTPGVAASTSGGLLVGYVAPTAPFTVRVEIAYGGKIYYGQARSTVNSSAIVIRGPVGVSYNALADQWVQAINLWEAAHPPEYGEFTWVYQGTQVPPLAAESYEHSPGIRLSYDPDVYQATEDLDGVVTLLKHEEESDAKATLWLRSFLGQWHKWTLSADGVIASVDLVAPTMWSRFDPPALYPGFGPEDEDDDDEPGDATDPGGSTPSGTCATMVKPLVHGTFYSQRTFSTLDKVHDPGDTWASDIYKVNGGTIATLCNKRYWRVNPQFGGTLVYKRVSGIRRYDFYLVTCPPQDAPTTQFVYRREEGDEGYVWYPIPDGYHSVQPWGTYPGICGAGTNDLNCNGVPNWFDITTRPCGWDCDHDGEGKTWDADCDTIPNWMDVDPLPKCFDDDYNETDDPNSNGEGDYDGDGIPNWRDPSPWGVNPKPSTGPDTGGPGPVEPGGGGTGGPFPNEPGGGGTGGPFPNEPGGGNNNACACMPTMPTYPNCDLDGDGINNQCDNDDDGDGIPDDRDPDSLGDRDGDGIPDADDPDMDGDGIPNHEDPDPDGDGEVNNDQDRDGDGIPNSEDDDLDGDGVPNSRDADLDGDGIPNSQDNDVDGDGRPNSQDSDDDGDGVFDTYCPAEGNGACMTEKPANPDDERIFWKLPGDESPTDGDLDGDGIPNGSDPDKDGDGIPNEDDPDADGDGYAENRERQPDQDCTPVGYLGEEWTKAQVEQSYCAAWQEAVAAPWEKQSDPGYGWWYCCLKEEEEEKKDCGCECFEKLLAKIDQSFRPLEYERYSDDIDDNETFNLPAPDLSVIQVPSVPYGGAPGVDLMVPLGEMGARVGIEELPLPIPSETGYTLPPYMQVPYDYLLINGQALLQVAFVCFISTVVFGLVWRVFA